MFGRRLSLSLGLLVLLTIAVGGVGLKSGGLSGWTIIRTPDGLRLDVPLDWAVDVGTTGTRFANGDEALGSPSVAAPQEFRALIVSGRLPDLPLPAGTDRSKVAAALAGDDGHRGVSFRGATSDGQTILIVKEVAPDRYGGVFASAAPGTTFPDQRALEEIVGDARYQAVDSNSNPGTVDFWSKHVQEIRHPDQKPLLWYELLVPEGKAPESGWPLLVLAHAATLSYASVVQDGLAIVVTPHFTWNTFEEDRQILDRILAEVSANYPVDDRRLVMHGCSVGGRFTFQYTVTEPNRVSAAVPMAAFDLRVPPPETWHIPFVFYYGDHDLLYANARAAIEGMQRKMDHVELYLDAGQGHVCDSRLALEAIRPLLVGR